MADYQDVSGLPADDTMAQLELQRKLKLAQALQQEKMPEGQMISGHYVAPSWTQSLANVYSKYRGGRAEEEAMKQYGQYAKSKEQKLGQALDTLNTDISPLAKQTMQDNFVDKPLEQGMNVGTSPFGTLDQVAQVAPKFGMNTSAPQNMQGNMSVNQPITSTTYEPRSKADIENAFFKYSKAIGNQDLANKYILAKVEKGLSSQTKWEKVGNNLVELDANGKPTGNVKNYEDNPTSYNEFLKAQSLGYPGTYDKWKILSTQTTPYQASEIAAKNKEQAYKYGTPPSNFSVTDPTGQVHYFPSKQAADGFKREIGQ
jgi:hypothetical protein